MGNCRGGGEVRRMVMSETGTSNKKRWGHLRATYCCRKVQACYSG